MSSSPIRFDSLLLPLDGSRMAEAVLPSAQAIAQRFGSRVTLIHVIEQKPPSTVHGERHLTRLDEADRYLEGVADRLRAAGVEVITHVHEVPEGDLAKSVVDHSEEFEPDIVVLSSHGEEGLRGLVFGRIAEQVLNRGRCPVLLIRPGKDGAPAPFEPANVMVPVDGVHDSESGLLAARDIATKFGASVHLVLAVPTMATIEGRERRSGVFLPSATRVMLELAEQGSADYLAREAARLREAGLQVTTEVLRGAILDTVLEQVERLQPGLIVLCGHGKTGLQALLSGSITHGIAHNAGCPLLLIRTPDEA